jgi:hypothetical protein
MRVTVAIFVTIPFSVVVICNNDFTKGYGKLAPLPCPHPRPSTLPPPSPLYPAPYPALLPRPQPALYPAPDPDPTPTPGVIRSHGLFQRRRGGGKGVKGRGGGGQFRRTGGLILY